MENTKYKNPESKVYILYKNRIIPAAVKNVRTFTDSEGTVTTYTLVDPEEFSSNNNVIGWHGIERTEEEIFNSVEDLLENLRTQYSSTYDNS